MAKAFEVAAQLRILAASLDSEPEAEIGSVRVTAWQHNKQIFLALARLMPRPIKKGTEDIAGKYVTITHETPALEIKTLIRQEAVCELVEPAKPAVYRCTPILSLEEEAGLEEGAK